MYCPNCGTEIYLEGSYCAKCKKNIAYIKKKAEQPKIEEIAVESEIPPELISSILAGEPLPETEVQAQTAKEPQAKPYLKTAPEKTEAEEIGFYCNYCGTFIYPEDNYCYSCGKKTRKQYYRLTNRNKNLWVGAGIAGILIVFIAIGYMLSSR